MIQKDMISFSGQKNEPFQSYMKKFVLPACKKGSIRLATDCKRMLLAIPFLPLDNPYFTEALVTASAAGAS